jgi:hypothetical protein
MDGTSSISASLPVAVIGAGLAGLPPRRSWRPAAKISSYSRKRGAGGNARVGPSPFPPRRYTVDEARRGLEPAGWTMPIRTAIPPAASWWSVATVPLAGIRRLRSSAVQRAGISVARRGMDRVPLVRARGAALRSSRCPLTGCEAAAIWCGR